MKKCLRLKSDSVKFSRNVFLGKTSVFISQVKQRLNVIEQGEIIIFFMHSNTSSNWKNITLITVIIIMIIITITLERIIIIMITLI